jgi:hypothetical protein
MDNIHIRCGPENFSRKSYIAIPFGHCFNVTPIGFKNIFDVPGDFALEEDYWQK